MKRNSSAQPLPGPASDAEALFSATCAGDLNDVMRLLNNGVSPTVCDEKGWTPLHVAAVWNQVHLIEPLVLAGADMEAKTPSHREFNLFPGCTALHCTVEWDALDAAHELIRCGANIDARNALGETPLRLAVETSGTYHLVSPLLAKFFIEAGADINVYDSGGYTIFNEASKAIDLAPGHFASQEIIAMLQERKAWMW